MFLYRIYGSFHVNSTHSINLTISDFHEILHMCTVHIDLEKYQISSRFVNSFLNYSYVKYKKIA